MGVRRSCLGEQYEKGVVAGGVGSCILLVFYEGPICSRGLILALWNTKTLKFVFFCAPRALRRAKKDAIYNKKRCPSKSIQLKGERYKNLGRDQSYHL